MSEDRQIFTLKQVVSSIRKTIEERYQQSYWIKAEMHKLNLYPSGHAFPELVQKENGKIVAQISSSIWKQNLQRINHQFISIVKEPLKEGSTLLLNAKIAFSETYGISLQILDIDPSYSLGELQKERQETLLKLEKEGLINRNQKLNFPLLPQRIAIISADTSKGLSDFMKVLNQNSWDYCFFTMLFQAYLQGDAAIDSIQNQLRQIEKVKDHFDVVVIVRGGGGEVGLSCYNNFELCRAIAQFPLPILTGIGHSTNFTVAEMISYRNAITPTELADFLIQSFHEFSVPVKEANEKVLRYSKLLIDNNTVQFEHVLKSFQLSTKQNLIRHQNNLKTTSHQFNAKTELVLHKSNQEINHIQINFQKSLKRGFLENRRTLSDIQSVIQQQTLKNIDQKQNELIQIQRSIDLLNPKNVMKRGYTVTRFNGKSVSKSNSPHIGDELEIEGYDLSLTVTTAKINTN